MLPRLFQIPQIDERDAIVVVLLRRLRRRGGRSHPPLAHTHMQLGIRRDLETWPLTGLFEHLPGFPIVLLLKELDALFERFVLQLGVGTPVRCGRRFHWRNPNRGFRRRRGLSRPPILCTQYLTALSRYWLRRLL